MTVSSVEPFPGQRVDDMVGSTRENAEPQESRQGGTKKCLLGFYHKRVLRGSEVVDCAVRRQMSLTARELLSHGALKSELYELREQKRRDSEELAKKKEKVKSKLKAAEETTARLNRDLRRSGHGKKRRTAKRGINSGSGGSSISNGSPEVRIRIHKKVKRK